VRNPGHLCDTEVSRTANIWNCKLPNTSAEHYHYTNLLIWLVSITRFLIYHPSSPVSLFFFLGTLFYATCNKPTFLRRIWPWGQRTQSDACINCQNKANGNLNKLNKYALNYFKTFPYFHTLLISVYFIIYL